MYEDQTYEKILSEAQGKISDEVQKGEGSLVYNALSALAFEIEKLYIQADFILRQSCAETADYEHLKLRASDRGIYPYEATNAQAEGTFNTEVPVGARFSLKAYNYVVAERKTANTYILQCEEPGTGPNGVVGKLTPITYVEGLESAEITRILVPGRDYEKQEDFYQRYLESFQSASFGGNIQAYKSYINKLPGVGGCKVFPVWAGPETVKVTIIGSDWRKITDYQISEIQESACPEPKMGYGFAPINHDVTIEAVEEIEISVKTSVTFGNGYSWAVSQEAIQDAVENYFLSLRKSWSEGDSEEHLTIYIARLESAILDVPGIVDVQETMLNEQPGNMVLTNTQIPVLQDVGNL